MEPPKSHHSRSATAPSHIGPIDHGVKKHRRHSSTGGSRSWTDDEESYLVRTRMNKMPYKHIAAQLQKTELACRLHYHQMSYGSNRRRRADSVSSTTSSYTSPSNSQGHSGESTPATGSQAPMGSKSPDSQSDSPPPSNYNSPGQTRTHVPILPKQASTSNLASIRYETPEQSEAKNLRLDTSFAQTGKHSFDHGLDYGLLRKLYDTHRDSFWSFIASQYSKGPDVTGRKLEEAFFQSTMASTDPLTPPDSPRSTSNRSQRQSSLSAPEAHRPNPGHSGFCAVNVSRLPSITEPSSGGERSSASDKCSVSSLLTVEKDVWAPREISTA